MAQGLLDCPVKPGNDKSWDWRNLNHVHRRIRDSCPRGQNYVPDGKLTDFRRAVDAKQGEKIVFSWQVWPDKATLEAVEAAMREDKRFEVSGEIPFDAKRLIYGC